MTAESPKRPEAFERPGGLLSKVDHHVVMYHDPRSVQAEQYRTCRTNLSALNRVGAPWAVVLTSSQRGEGKSVTAANLAACMAELPGTRVCLVDLDFRAPSQHDMFGTEAGAGVTALIHGEASFKDVVRPTLVPQLELIPAGPEPDNPAELLGSDRFENLVQELKRRYSWVLIDTPPVHPFTDACVVTKLTNGALVVVRLGETDRELVNRTLDNITSAGGAVLGTFCTGVQPHKEEYDRHGYYQLEGADRALHRDEMQRRKARERAERRLRSQEKAFLKRRQKEQDADDDDAPV